MMDCLNSTVISACKLRSFRREISVRDELLHDSSNQSFILSSFPWTLKQGKGMYNQEITSLNSRTITYCIECSYIGHFYWQTVRDWEHNGHATIECYAPQYTAVTFPSMLTIVFWGGRRKRKGMMVFHNSKYGSRDCRGCQKFFTKNESTNNKVHRVSQEDWQSGLIFWKVRVP